MTARTIDGGRRMAAATRIALIAVAAILVLVPFAWMASIAFTPAEQAFGSISLIPDNPTTANFEAALTQIDLLRALGNSLVVALVCVAANCLVAPLAGYAFARLKFPGSGVVLLVIVATTAIPVSVTLIPLFLMAKTFPLAGGNDLFGSGGTGLLDTLAVVTIPHLVGAMNVFLSRQYFAGMGSELAEAARLDGAGEWRIYWRVYLPLARPLIAVVAIFSFTGTWDDFLWPLVTTTSQEHYTVQLALVQFNATGNVQYGPLMAGAILITLPVLAVFLLNQRSFISGLAEGGTKG
ncbi:carbohydrate ABC transporter permease [Glycomyces artemisiae]|uniref:Carbohydrate ABC transporter membrane protein 2 (CUT1 family) n=1 Tax=Glycomyces artemisiae TaxID=1076443 RepID=A0A2T0UL42_9ACTN|nr:carbohydrate ABC transporter permease [Glycomyces artemisiae]PRY58651.1 carbohydrate ABC transporter membrane protein 2 (CUT1 family) [Glycomyces artemisiae]